MAGAPPPNGSPAGPRRPVLKESTPKVTGGSHFGSGRVCWGSFERNTGQWCPFADQAVIEAAFNSGVVRHPHPRAIGPVALAPHLTLCMLLWRMPLPGVCVSSGLLQRHGALFSHLLLPEHAGVWTKAGRLPLGATGRGGRGGAAALLGELEDVPAGPSHVSAKPKTQKTKAALETGVVTLE